MSVEEFASEAWAFAIGSPARAYTTSANVRVTAIDDDDVPLQEVVWFRRGDGPQSASVRAVLILIPTAGVKIFTKMIINLMLYFNLKLCIRINLYTISS